MLNRILLNDGWIFEKGYSDTYKIEEIDNAENVTLPHCYNAIDGQDGNGMFRGKCFYQKIINIHEEELSKTFYLEVGAASLVSEVYINGQLASINNCGFSMYRVDLTPYIKVGENLISIMVDNSEHQNVYPIMADFSFYGGVYRDVYLVITEGVNFDLLDKSRDGVYITQTKLSNEKYHLEINGAICSKEERVVKVIFNLKDKEKVSVIKKEIDIEVNNRTEFRESLVIESPHLWQGIENPYLYTVELQIKINNSVVDCREIEVGFRTIEITSDKGAFLNGKHIKFNGVARHQDFGGVGNAVTKEQMELDMSIMKEMGVNTVRLSHYQHDDYFYKLCDQEGILVWAEIPFISVPIVKDTHNKNAKDQMECLIKQCYNHSSIYCWGVQNEITIASENKRTYEMVSELEAYAKSLDSSRYTSQANIYSVANDSYINTLTDLVGYNLYYGWYYKEIEDLQIRLDEFHSTNPQIPLMVTEYGVDTNPQYHSYEPKVKDYTEEYQLLFSDNALRAFDERQYMVGGYVWNMFDFGSSMRDEGGTKGKNQKGLVTLDRKIKKDSFYLYKAYWSNESFVKLASSRFVNRHKKENDIVVLSNVNKLELYVNGELVRNMDREVPMSKFEKIELNLGKNTILAKGYDNRGNEYKDEMVLNYEDEIDMSYIIEKKEETTHVINWFEKFDLSGAEEITLKDGYYSTFDTIAELYENDDAKAVFNKYLGDMANHERFKSMAGIMTIDGLSKLSAFKMPKELLIVINKELNQIKK